VAAGDEVVLSRPGATGVTSTGWLVLGGTALFIAGHAAFKLAVWRVVSWPRVGAIVVLGLLGLVAGDLPALALGLCAVVVVVGVAAIDYRWRLSSPV
jgi:low temperature requirement protein LtrA